jgi:hypothetical protein
VHFAAQSSFLLFIVTEIINDSFPKFSCATGEKLYACCKGKNLIFYIGVCLKSYKESRSNLK